MENVLQILKNHLDIDIDKDGKLTITDNDGEKKSISVKLEKDELEALQQIAAEVDAKKEECKDGECKEEKCEKCKEKKEDCKCEKEEKKEEKIPEPKPVPEVEDDEDTKEIKECLDYKLYKALDENGFVPSNKNLELLKEGIISGRYEILDTSDILVSESASEDSVLSQLLEKNEYAVTDENKELLESKFDKGEILLSEGIFKKFRNKRKARKRMKEMWAEGKLGKKAEEKKEETPAEEKPVEQPAEK